MRSPRLRLPVLVVMILGGISSSVWAWSSRTVVERVYVEPIPTAAIVPTTYETTSWVLPTSYEPTAWVTPTSYFTPTSYVVPTSTTYSTVYPTSYSTSYVVPTSATYSTVYPTSYAAVYPTTYAADSVFLAPTAYALETTYRRRGLFGRRWRVDRPVVTAYTPSYLATSYVVPMSFPVTGSSTTLVRDPGLTQVAYSMSTGCPCPTSGGMSAPASSAPPASGAPKSVKSQPTEDSSVTSSAVGPAPAEIEKPVSRPADRDAVKTATETKSAATRLNDDASMENPGGVGGDNTPPAPVTAGKPPTTVVPPRPGVVTKPAASTPANPAVEKAAPKSAITKPEIIEAAPAAPGDEPAVMPAPEKPESLRSESRKPVFPTQTPRIRTATTRNVLYGMVESSTAGEPEEGVPVTLASVTQTGTNRVTLTNAFGKFAIRVPDGTYDVLVTMPSGRKHVIDGPLGRISVKNGQITDQEGHDIPSVIITR